VAKSKSGARRATPVEATKHVAARRKNIPTAELEAFAREAEKSPETMLYPREPSLDPQLVWKGKDQQDRQDLAVPVVPIYIQEKIAPRAIIENLRAEKRAASEPQLDLFGDFNGLEFEQLIEFYQHSQHWSNRMILGDSLQVMASLAEKEGLKGQVQMMYVDPPYGIKFGSNWQVSTRKRDIVDGRAQDMSREPEQVRAFRDTWHMGIHSYLAFLRDRLVAARELLTETGSIFVQIGEENLHLVRCLLDEVMGRENFVSVITFSKTAGATTELLPGVADYIVWYARDSSRAKYRRLFTEKIAGGPGAGKYDQVELPDGTRRSLGVEERTDSLLPGSRVFRLDNLTSQSVGREKGEGAASWFPVRLEQREFTPTMRSRWKTNEAGMAKLLTANRVAITGNTLSYVRFIEDFPAFPITNVWLDIGGIQSRADPKVYVVQTATTAIERCLLMTTDPGDLVLDPTSGSGTTAHVAEQWGRRWIVIDTSRVALAIARTRLMAARYPYYILRDSSQGIVKEAQVTSTVPPSPLPPTAGDIRQGFVYERVPHVTLKSIATNPNLHEGMTREEVDRSIARHAEAETLFDRPYTDSRIVRVTGPFTVEGLSPHRLLPEEPGARPDGDAASFIQMILGNLAKAGVQNTVKRERLVFDRLEPWPGGRYVQAAGGYTENGKSKTAAIAIGPEFGTVGPEFVREAAKEAIRFADLLVVCGFAFEAHVGEESGQLGRLTIVKAKMNPDLAMGDELLKKTGSGNLFMVFGEPDIAIESAPDGRFTTEIRGVDVFDPTMGVIRGHSTDDIAAWFLDTNYDGESFFVRHAYFLGADDPYDNLQRALKADIDEAAWQSLHSTKSRLFPRPETGKIAVKVINHYGDEVLKVYGIK
jgi:adenine-specific DNA-methyltransferase